MIFTIFGYPKTGKTTLFNILTGLSISRDKFSVSNEVHRAVVDVPDERVDKLNEIFNTKKKYTKIEYFDTGAVSFGEVKDTKFFDTLRKADGLIHVVRNFEDDEILHPEGTIDYKRDIKRMEEELVLADYISCEGKLERLRKDYLKMKTKEIEFQIKLFEKLKTHLDEGKPLRELELSKEELKAISGFEFLSLKPIIHVVNSDDNGMKKVVFEEGKGRIVIGFLGEIEEEIHELSPEERREFMKEYGIKESMRDRIIKNSYKLLELVTFITAGEKEVRAWPIKKGSSVYEAAGKIHSDIQKGFIRAEVIEWDRLYEAHGWKGAKEKNYIRLEGKDYIIKDGDVINIRFNPPR